MYRVALIGHSNVPREQFSIPNTLVEVFRSPGGRATTFYDNDLFTSALEREFELAILFLGSNDISPDLETWEVTNAIKRIVQDLHDRCQAKVALVKIEPRVISVPPGPGIIDQGRYNRVSGSINRKLSRELGDQVDFINFGAPYYRDHLKADGVHWRREGRRRVHNNLSKYIHQQCVDDGYESLRARH